MSDHLRRAYLAEDDITLHGNLPGDFGHDDLHGPARVYTAVLTRDAPHRGDRPDRYYPPSNDTRQNHMAQPLRPDGRLNLRPKEWSGATYMLAPCPHATASHEIKSLVLENAIENIRSGTGKWRNKIDCLVNHFNQPLVLTSAELETKAFHEFDSPLFKYTFLHVCDAAYQPIPVPTPNEADVATHAFRANARYVTAEMTLDARAFFARPDTDGNHRLPGANTKIVYIRLPQDIALTTEPPQLHMAFHDHRLLRDIRGMVTTCRFIQESLQFGTLERGHFTQDSFEQWIEDTKQHTKFEIVCRLIRPAFVGEGLIETPINRLVKCKQVTTNDRGNGHAATVSEHYERFTAIVGQLNVEAPYQLNITETFFNSLSHRLQGKLLRRNYKHPSPRNNQEHLAALQHLRDIALEEEKEMESNLQMFRSVMAPQTRLNQARNTRSFMAVREHNPVDDLSEYDDPLMEQCKTLYHLMENHTTTETEQGHVFLSPAEQALRNASGTIKPIECWGCMNMEGLHQNRFHRFYDCPNKDNPEVRRNAAMNMKKARQQWEAKKNLERETAHNENTPYSRKRDTTAMLTRAEILKDWQQLGFDTPETAQQVANASAITACDIPAKRRRHLINEWVEQQRATYGQVQGDKVNRTLFIEASADERGGYTFLSPATHVSGKPVATVAFHANITTRMPLEISPTLPHCDIPIGSTEGQGKLKVALDSCAGVNIGHLSFHQAMYDVFPEMVATFQTMSAYGEDNVTIGGVEASTAGNLQLTHVIEYKTPFRYRGEPCTIAFGLSEKAAATAILSINFLRKTKALWSYDDTAPNVHLTIWNTTLRVNYEQPTRRDPPTPQTRFRQATTAVYSTRTNTSDHE